MRLILALACAVAFLFGAQTGQAQEEGDAGTDAFNNGDYAGAMEAWRAKAAEGDPEAMTNVGTLYNLGLGVKRDYGKAAEWYEKAGQLGFVLAQFNLGNLYYGGQGVSRDLKQAARWYTAAAEGGHPKAQFYLAQMYESGEGVDESKQTALAWYQKAVDQNLPDAQFELGKKLVYGEDMAADGSKGTDLLIKAAEQRFVKAQILLADCYWRARGVPKNQIEAYVWAAQAKDLAKGRDQKRAGELYDDIKSGMNGDQIKAAEIELMAVSPTKKKKKKDGEEQDPGADGSDE